MSIKNNYSIIIALEDNTISDGIQDALNHMATLSPPLDISYIQTNHTESLYKESFKNNKVIIGINLDLSTISLFDSINEITCLSPKVDAYYDVFYHKINLIGYQRQFISQQILKGLEVNSKSNISLGLLSQDISISEHIFRKSELIEFNLSTLKGSEFQVFSNGNPAGLISEQFIQLAKYAGYSDNIKILNFKFSKDLEFGNEHFISKLIGTSIWYFEESIIQALEDHDDELIMSVVEHEHDFIYFFKSPNTGKCYYSYEEDDKKESCSSQEYENAIKRGIISEKIQRRIIN